MSQPPDGHLCAVTDWVEGYAGYTCQVCNAFVPFGSEPWAPDYDPHFNGDELYDDEGDDDEPVGSCDNCGVNLEADEMTEWLCDQCSWWAVQG